MAILSLALGVGANTAIFQLLDAVRLRTLPVENPQQLMEIRIAESPGGRTGQFLSRRPNLSNPLWERIRDGQQAFSSATGRPSSRRYITRLWPAIRRPSS